MKMVLMLLFLLPLHANALLADRFKCEIEVKDSKSARSTQQTSEFFIARLPLNSSPAPDIRQTLGHARSTTTLNLGALILQADLGINYWHAMRVDPAGQVLEARQQTCSGLNVGYCEGNRCSVAQSACPVHSDPFNPHVGWPVTQVVNGNPIFNETGLLPAQVQIIVDMHGRRLGTAKAACKYMGTFD